MKLSFLVYVLVVVSLGSIIVGLVPHEFHAQSASASPDSYSDTIAFCSFSVEGATLVKKTQAYSTDWEYLFVTPSEGQITITAETNTNGDYGSGELYLFGGHSNFADPPVELDSDSASAGLPLSVSGSMAIDHALQDADISASFANNSREYIHLYLFAKPTITTVEVNATTVTRAARVYGQVIPKDYSTDVYVNYTREGQTGRFVDAESGISTGSFADTFNALDYPAGNWTAIAQVNASYGSKLSLLMFSEFPKDILVDSKSVSFTTQPSTGEQQAKLIWKIARFLGDVEVLLSDSPEWTPAVVDMGLGPGDTIITGHSVNDIVVLQTAIREISLFLTNGNELKVEGPSVPTDNPEEYIDPEEYVLGVLTLGGDSYYDVPSLGTGPKVRVETPDAVVTDSGTQFEILVDSTGTTVRTFSGSVQVVDLNNTYSVDVDEGQTSAVLRGGVPSNPAAFDPSTVDEWWNVVPEFPPVLFLPIFMMSTLLAVIVYSRKPR